VYNKVQSKPIYYFAVQSVKSR